MRTYLLVKGKQGVLVGNPFSSQFVGQKKRVLKEGERPRNVADAHEPVLAVVPKHPDIVKHIKRGELDVIEEFQAENYTVALTKLESKPAVKKESK